MKSKCNVCRNREEKIVENSKNAKTANTAKEDNKAKNA